jgi:hypothetical protein
MAERSVGTSEAEVETAAADSISFRVRMAVEMTQHGASLSGSQVSFARLCDLLQCSHGAGRLLRS